MARHQEDYMTEGGANSLAYTIRKYWEARGVHVKTWVQPITSTVLRDQKTIYCVRSNLNAVYPGAA